MMSRIFGLTGAPGAGKSTVAKILAGQHGAQIIDADSFGHAALLDRDNERQLRRIFGDAIFTGEHIDRQKLGAVVFADAARLRQLEAIVHPWIKEQILRELSALTAEIIGLDAPLLKALASDELYEEIWLITAPFDLRLARVANRGWDAGELARRDRCAQLYAANAPKVIEIVNDGDAVALAEKIRRRMQR
ncbi:hypothetical protein AGMMS49959_11550 [Planctomycetales bacterium]|nr:hypothetical protein AGMMS49959_11550 [Planctomycetales bacterium]